MNDQTSCQIFSVIVNVDNCFCRLEQDRLQHELDDLERNINKKEELAHRLSQPSEETNRLRAQYEKQLKELENNRSKLEKERTDLVMVRMECVK